MGVLNIPVVKAGGKTIAIDTDTDLDDRMFKLALEEGLKVLINAKMSKITAQSKLEGAELEASQAAAMEIAEKNLAAIKAGEFKKGGRGASASSTKIPREVMTEARRLAKEVIKNEIRAAGMKISHVEPRDITAAANNLLETDPSYIEQAKANIEARNVVAPVATDNPEAKAAAAAKLASLGFAGESEKKLKEAEERKVKSKAVLSATQAGKAAPRKGAQPTAH
jgi:hypothetical protein